MTIALRDITDLAGCRAVVGVQEAVWGRDSEVVPASLLAASAKRGGILIGAFDGQTLVGFVWSMPGWHNGQPTQWSHMLAVLPDARRASLGERLKWAQRDRALASTTALIEWTFDPLQAANAHLNFACLGAVASEYRVNAYGEMVGPLHRGTPTDRLVAEWRIREPHVERRKGVGGPDQEGKPSRSGPPTPFVARDASVLQAVETIDTREDGEWTVCAHTRIDVVSRRVLVAVPPRFTEMQAHAPEPAMAWRLAAREVFSAYFARGYRAVDFFLNRSTGGGQYLLAASEGT